MQTRREFCGVLAAAATARRARAAATGKLKITGFRTHKVTLRWRDLMFLEVLTDGGITGLGEATLETRTDLAEQALRWLEQHMVGLDPAGPEEHWDRNYYRLSRWRNGPDIFTALSAVDIALWDIEGKRLGVPVWRLLGGPVHPKLRVYHTHWDATLPARTPSAISEHAARTHQKGWTAIKFTVPLRGPEPERRRIATQQLEAIRQAVGDSMDICLEAAEGYTVRSAIEFARAVAPYKPLFLEEPVWRENPAALGEVAAKSPVPIATGEGIFSRYEFRQLLEAKGAAIVQPDVMHAGGITEIRKIANLAETFGAEIAPHQCSGPVGHVASITVMSVCRNFLIEEWEGADDGLYLELTGGKYPVQKEGYVSLPEGPGLGIEVDFEQFKRRFPYKPITKRT